MYQPGLLRHIGKNALAIVVIQNVLTPAGDEDVVETVIVVVAHRNTCRPYTAAKAGLGGDILKSSIPVVVIQADCRLRWSRVGPSAARQHHDVLPAVVVIIQTRHATSHGIENEVRAAFVPIEHRRM